MISRQAAARAASKAAPDRDSEVVQQVVPAHEGGRLIRRVGRDATAYPGGKPSRSKRPGRASLPGVAPSRT
jgi:hypothetical protein